MSTSSQPPASKKRALLIGINYYGTSNQLSGCINDVRAVETVLKTQMGYSDSDITRLNDDVTDITVHGLPTLQNILHHIQEITAFSKTNVDTEIWIHYSGHGSSQRDTNRDELDGSDETIVPLDYQTNGMIVDDEINLLLRGCKGTVLCFFDSCHSGSVCDLPWQYACCNRGLVRSSATRSAPTIINAPNIYCMSGARDNQTAADAWFGLQNTYYGAFTRFFLQALQSANYKGRFDVLYWNTCKLLKNSGYTQVPVMSSSSTAILYVFGTGVVRSLPKVTYRGQPVFETLVAENTKKQVAQDVVKLTRPRRFQSLVFA